MHHAPLKMMQIINHFSSNNAKEMIKTEHKTNLLSTSKSPVLLAPNLPKIE
jgi:hypothetical protein